MELPILTIFVSANDMKNSVTQSEIGERAFPSLSKDSIVYLLLYKFMCKNKHVFEDWKEALTNISSE